LRICYLINRETLYNKADDAGEKIIGEIRQSGNEPMRIRASGKESVRFEETEKFSGKIAGHGKKKLSRHTAFGEITVPERVFIKNGHLIRPFPEYCEVGCRGYPLPPQRGITDSVRGCSFRKSSWKNQGTLRNKDTFRSGTDYILPKVINCDYQNLMKTVSFSVIFYYTAISVFKIG